MLDFKDLYKRAGIIRVSLIDPLSLLINKILGLEDSAINAIGYYYEEKYNGKTKCKVLLYNIYDNEIVTWMKMGYTMDLLIVSPFVNKIIFQPLKLNDINKNIPIINRNGLNMDLFKNFREICKNVSYENEQIKYDKNITYMNILVNGVSHLPFGSINNDDKRITGKNIVKKIISRLSIVNSEQWDKTPLFGICGTNTKQSKHKMLLFNPDGIAKQWDKTPLFGICGTNAKQSHRDCSDLPLKGKFKQGGKTRLFGHKIKIITNDEAIYTDDTYYIIEETRKDIVNLIAIFIDLYTLDIKFRNKILNNPNGTIRTHTERVNLNNDIISLYLDNLLKKEVEINNNIVSAGLNGLLYKDDFNTLIRELNIERKNVNVNVENLLEITDYNKNIVIIDDDIMCTFIKEETTENYNDDLNKLGSYLNKINELLKNEAVAYINWNDIIKLYNNIIKKKEIKEIENTYSKMTILTFNNNSDRILNDKYNILTTEHNNLKKYSTEKLMDILIYLDSMNDNLLGGLSNNKFCKLQNDITYELSMRNNN
jgi:hypothetical protein